MFNSLLGIGLGVFGAYSLYTNTQDFTPFIYLKFGGMMLLGFGIALWNSVPTLLSSLSNFKLPTLPKKENTVAKELSKDIHMKTEEEQDLASVFYLTERLKDMPEGVELCSKLNGLIFTLHHPLIRK